MERYFMLYPDDENRAILHYRCNLELAEAFYTSLFVFILLILLLYVYYISHQVRDDVCVYVERCL